MWGILLMLLRYLRAVSTACSRLRRASAFESAKPTSSGASSSLDGAAKLADSFSITVDFLPGFVPPRFPGAMLDCDGHTSSLRDAP